MKKVLVFITCLLIVLVSNAQHRQKNNKVNTTLVIEFVPVPKMPVGYGYTFLCLVKSVELGKLDQLSFWLTVLAAANDSIYKKLLQYNSQKPAIGVFELYKKNVPYNMMPITGFVDEHKVAWILKELK